VGDLHLPNYQITHLPNSVRARQKHGNPNVSLFSKSL
jgi:hypothetical protein